MSLKIYGILLLGRKLYKFSSLPLIFGKYCSGHRIGTAEVESALVSHHQCAEAAVVGVDHEVYL